MKDPFIKFIVLAIVLIIVLLSFVVFGSRVDYITNTPTSLYKKVSGNYDKNEQKKIINSIVGDSEINDLTEMQKCLISLLGSETILKIQNDIMEITPDVNAVIEECNERIANL
ncbi:MAG: hypothetical protein A2725_03625 [Candidatus Magasanikbacteria bacterium RIFCSPHIGHO2_01_FULL_33_34]|uniref:Uncharacterized protein n=1 Tax=Candidatus Magasanikbacteria bacterium RIFCSPHIGHO2_01_FULL_33_34 TaxID=1798671 RepID=A0A1F6LHP3_9BACT|nr:MAG: hypothetical protein A2725_03625 [Candidatus Magasanikbacteria bacterium RIFCSPHIGHO2_01_FULL_33_34]OGH65061.1 MAG: hypothetical protein A3B83_03385 [Candidatus Magasanikbacteria bacterium RIFCSPHIGHO2_02_FULL_33_17]OGH75395.1 MAG: hypothetical protein A3A89_04780 [Candidatus Magasanikbacteria bacterium RIFCSPLOWO2_01_FULL_33_34]OGH81454.1 MAG: hypothetical protein A3F93_02570 [Candidatus Magasanikbacteria bacterium RIFCSPLOWO2_12_FULL_34_7]